MTIWGATFQETHIRASFSSPHRVMARAGGGVGAHPAIRIASRKLTRVARAHCRRKYTGPQHASADELARAAVGEDFLSGTGEAGGPDNAALCAAIHGGSR